MKAQIESIKSQIKALYLNKDAADFSEAWAEIKEYGNDFDDEAQEEMANKAEELVDSFGGDISARELAGD